MTYSEYPAFNFSDTSLFPLLSSKFTSCFSSFKNLSQKFFLLHIRELSIKCLCFLFIYQIPCRRCILSCNSIKISRYQFFAQKERCILAFRQSMIADAKLACLFKSAFFIKINISFKAYCSASKLFCFFQRIIQ